MRTVKWNAFLSGICGFAVALGVVAAAHADVTTEKGASILIFPKVRSTLQFNTVIQIANTGNSMVHARCFYVDASLFSTLNGAPCTVPGPTCVANWQETDFDIWLTKQQPTHWVASTGRLSFAGLPGPDLGPLAAGFPPGRIPPVGNAFEGELKCVEVTENDDPLPGNHLKGEATIEAITTAVLPCIPPLNTPDLLCGFAGSTTLGDVSKYNAIGIEGNPNTPPTSNKLPLDGQIYDACPAQLIVNHFAGGLGASDPVASELNTPVVVVGSVTNTELTLVPCAENFETQVPTASTIQFLVTNEFEQKFSASTTVLCYLSTFLTEIDSPTEQPPEISQHSVFSRAVLGTTVATTTITPVVNTDGTVHAVVGVVERETTVIPAGGVTFATARAAYNIHTRGDLIPSTGPEEIVLSEP